MCLVFGCIMFIYVFELYYRNLIFALTTLGVEHLYKVTSDAIFSSFSQCTVWFMEQILKFE